MSDSNAKMFTSPQRKAVIMTNSELQTLLAKNILARYTPFAFTCVCGGADYDCQDAMEDPYMNGIMDTLNRVAKYINDFTPES